MKKLVIVIWGFLSSCCVYAYSEQDRLINGDSYNIKWRQGKNNDNGCSPSYNSFCPYHESNNSSCDRAVTGCASVAGCIAMFKWKWPHIKDNYYDWDNISYTLHDGSPTDLPRLIRDCGNAMNSNYEEIMNLHVLEQTWTLPSDLASGMRSMRYSCRYYDEDEWTPYGNAWNDLLTSELKNGRPVIFYGEKSGLNKSHYYVLEGYSWNNTYAPIYGQNDTQAKTFESLSALDYPNNTKAFIGISPKIPTMTNRVNSFTMGSRLTEVNAKYAIDLTSVQTPIEVQDGKALVMIAGDSIVLNAGFEVKSGGKFKALINPDYKVDHEISYDLVYNSLNKKCTESPNHKVKFVVSNADSWENVVYDRTGRRIWRSAGVVEGDTIEVWDGTATITVYNTETYWIVLTLKNNYGKIVDSDPIPIAINNVPCPIEYHCTNGYLSNGDYVFTPHCLDGINDYIEYETNAETWQSKIWDRRELLLATYSGNVENGVARVIGPSICDVLDRGGLARYAFEVRFRTTAGGDVTTSGDFCHYTNSCPRNMPMTSLDGVDPVVDMYELDSINMQIDLFPVPATDEFSITVMGSSETDVFKLTIEDVRTGNVVYSRTGVRGNRVFVRDAFLPKGVYVVKMMNGVNFVSKAFVVK